jgi:hypothetical protein
MIARRALLAALAGSALPAALAQGLRDTAVPVHGQLLSRSSGPVPGVSVSLVHQALGRSAASRTDSYGRFGWTAIPVRPEPYYLEMYWGSKLIYRSLLAVQGPLVLQPIVL